MLSSRGSSRPRTEPGPPAAPALAGRPFTAGLPATPFVTRRLLAFYCCLNSLPKLQGLKARGKCVITGLCRLEVWHGCDGTRSKLARALVPSLGSRERALSRFQLPELLALLGSGPSSSSGQQERSPLGAVGRPPRL